MHILKTFVVAALLTTSCVFSPQFGDGQISCSSAGACPPGFTCAQDRHCYRSLPLGDGSAGRDLAGSDLAGCVPATCMQNVNCGHMPDGCGGTLNCPPCGVPHLCSSAVPFSCQCVLKSCSDWGANCGTPPDNCDGQLSSCGSCSTGTCGGGGVPYQCGPGNCVPKNVAAGCAPDYCGKIPDGCGGILHCGDSNCKNGTHCGGGGRPNECG